MNEQSLLLAIMQVHESNFHMLHWKTIGCDFNDGHKEISKEYYEMVFADKDDVAERMLRQGLNPCNYMDVIKVLQTNGKNIPIVTSEKDYTRDEIVKLSDRMLGDIVNAIISVLQSDAMTTPENIGIKSYYEALLDKYDAEYRFLNKKRLC